MVQNNLQLLKLYKEALNDTLDSLKPWLETYDSLTFSQKREFERQLTVTKQLKQITKALNDNVDLNIKDYLRDVGDKTYIDLGDSLNFDNTIIDTDYLEALIDKPIAGQRLSGRLHKDRNKLAERSTNAIRRGLIKGDSYDKIAGRLRDLNVSSYNNAMRIVRTESSRISSEVTQKGYQDAKKLGIKLKKKWVSGHDNRTRSSHAKLDGQIVDIDEEFEINGHKALGPSLFGIAAEDINCRCTTVEVLDDEEVVKEKGTEPLFSESISSQLTDMQQKQYEGMLRQAPDDIQVLFDKYKGDLNLADAKYKGGAHYKPWEKSVYMDIAEDLAGSNYSPSGNTFFHEFGHAIDGVNGQFSKSVRPELGHEVSLRDVMSDEWNAWFGARHKELKDVYKKLGRQEFIATHSGINSFSKSQKSLLKGDAQSIILGELNKEYDIMERGDISDWLEYTTKKSYPLGVGHGTAYHAKGDKTSKEIFAEITAAYVTNPKSLSLMKKMFPDTIRAYDKLIKGLI